MSFPDSISKKLYALKSRTMRFFGVYAATAWLALPSALDQAKASLPELQQYIPENAYKWLSLAVIVGGIYYRLRTSAPLAEYKQAPAAPTEGGA